MQRWFYANEELICRPQHVDKPTSEEENRIADMVAVQNRLRQWHFCVTFKQSCLMPNETVAVSGNCDQLGNWQLENCVLMVPCDKHKQQSWRVCVDIPAARVVSYRYLIVAIDPEGQQMIVRFFESHLKPRMVLPEMEFTLNDCPDTFGFVEDNLKVERGWITNEHILQFLFFKAPFKWQYEGLCNERELRVKVTPAYRTKPKACAVADEPPNQPLGTTPPVQDCKIKLIDDLTSESGKEKSSIRMKLCGENIFTFTKLRTAVSDIDCENQVSTQTKVQEEIEELPQPEEVEQVSLSTAFAFSEAVNLAAADPSLCYQPTFGTRCGPKDLVMIHLTIGDFKNTVYLIEIFAYSKNAGVDEDPYRVGYRYLLPEDFETFSQGYIEAPIICASTHRLLGNMKFRFLVMRPCTTWKYDLSVSYLRHWNPKGIGLDVGHRGLGASFRSSKESIVYENTIYSMQQAIANGADMVELDVQLSKDFVPIVYHDFKVHVSISNPTVLQNFKNLDYPLCKFTYKELQNFKLHNSSTSTPLTRIGDAAVRQQLFPRLSDVLEDVTQGVPIIIEIKWPQQYCNGNWEDGFQPRIDRNFYIDRVLKVVMENAKQRRIIFSCFDADMCALLRFKQNRYPVMYLVRDPIKIPFLDARSNSPLMAMNFAIAMELLGLVPHADILLPDTGFIGDIKANGLAVFCYGTEDAERINILKNLGVNAVIFDRIDQVERGASQYQKFNCNCECCMENLEKPAEGGGDMQADLSIWEDF